MPRYVSPFSIQSHRIPQSGPNEKLRKPEYWQTLKSLNSGKAFSLIQTPSRINSFGVLGKLLNYVGLGVVIMYIIMRRHVAVLYYMLKRPMEDIYA